MVGIEVRAAPVAVDEPWVQTLGIIDGGLEVMRAAWPKLEHVFSVRRSNEEGKSEASPEPAHIFREPHRLPNGLLNKRRVDLLNIEQGVSSKPPLNFEWHAWEKLVSRTRPKNRPRVVDTPMNLGFGVWRKF